MFVYKLLKSMVNKKQFIIEALEFQKFNKTQVVIENGIKFTIRFLRKMSDEYRGWCKIHLYPATIGHPTGEFLRIFQIMWKCGIT